MAKRRDDDPIQDYVEWTEHRYTPGYYVGGKRPPWLRASAGPRTRRRLGWLLLVGGTISFVLRLSTSIAWGSSVLDAFLEATWIVIVIGAGTVMLRSSRRPASRRKRH